MNTTAQPSSFATLPLKKASDKIKQINNELEIKVAQRTAQLEKASQVKRFYINISHKIRTPLNGVLNLIKRVTK